MAGAGIRGPARQPCWHEFDPIPFGAGAARIFGRVTAAVIAGGRKPRRRMADLMIAAIAIAEELPLFTTSPDDFAGLETLLTVVPVTRMASPTPKTSMLSDDRTAMASGQPPRRAAARNGAGRPG
jgi:hypothetical protein